MINFDQIRVDRPINPLDGTETFIVNQGGVTRGGFLSALLAWIQNTIEVSVDAISESGSYASTILGFDDLEDARATLLPDDGTAEEILTGTETEARIWSPDVLADAIDEIVTEAVAIPGPVLVNDDVTLDGGIARNLVKCNPTEAIVVTLPALALPEGTPFKIINLENFDVTVTPASVTLIDSTGPIVDLVLSQYDSANFTYIDEDTWFVE